MPSSRAFIDQRPEAPTSNKYLKDPSSRYIDRLPNVLVISNDPFSKENANGRTLGNFFLDYPKGQLAQLFLNDAPLDLIDCPYFQISDRNLFEHFTKFKKVGLIDRKSVV